MQRIAAVLASVVLVLGNGALPLLHVHLYDDHDHAEHHHGPAFHVHGHAQAQPAYPAVPTGPLVGRCAPDAHVLALTATLASSPDQLVVPALAPAVTVVANHAPPRPFVARPEVRSHSPPGLTDSPLRAPPHSLPA